MPLINLTSELIHILSTAGIGLLVGALLTEGCLLVPYWRSLSADRFHALYRELHPLLYRYFTPLTVAPLVLSLIAVVIGLVISGSKSWLTLTAGVLMVWVTATHEVYFKKANSQFAAGSLSPDALSNELARWSAWNWFRVGLGLMAFGASLLGLWLG